MSSAESDLMPISPWLKFLRSMSEQMNLYRWWASTLSQHVSLNPTSRLLRAAGGGWVWAEWHGDSVQPKQTNLSKPSSEEALAAAPHGTVLKLFWSVKLWWTLFIITMSWNNLKRHCFKELSIIISIYHGVFTSCRLFCMLPSLQDTLVMLYSCLFCLLSQNIKHAHYLP